MAGLRASPKSTKTSPSACESLHTRQHGRRRRCRRSWPWRRTEGIRAAPGGGPAAGRATLPGPGAEPGSAWHPPVTSTFLQSGAAAVPSAFRSASGGGPWCWPSPRPHRPGRLEAGSSLAELAAVAADLVGALGSDPHFILFLVPGRPRPLSSRSARAAG